MSIQCPSIIYKYLDRQRLHLSKQCKALLTVTMESDTMGLLPIVHYDNYSIIISNRSKGLILSFLLYSEYKSFENLSHLILVFWFCSPQVMHQILIPLFIDVETLQHKRFFLLKY